jgi:hypothetical protein
MTEQPPLTERSLRARLAYELPWCALVLAGALLPLVALLVTGHTLAWRDTSQLFAPLRGLISDALRAGRLPLWNPYEATGMPLFAQLLHGVLHPWSVLAALLAPGDGTDLLIVLHVATGALGAGVLARSLGASRRGAAVAGLGYGLSGYLLGMSAVIQYLAAAGSAPWAVAAVRAAARGGAGRIAVGAVGIAVLFFSGDPQWTMIAALMGLLLARESAGWRGAARALAAVAAGTALAGIQLVPTWVFLHASNRSAGLTPQDSVQWALAPARLAELVIPGFFAGRPGHSFAPVFSWLGGSSLYPMPFLPSVFVGLPVIALAAAGLRTGRVGRLLGWSALVFLWLSLGHFAGATQALSWVPVWSSFRYAEKLMGPLTLCLSLLAALGLERYQAGVTPRAGRPAVLGLCLVLAAVCFGVVRVVEAPAALPPDVWLPLGERLAAGFLLAALWCGAVMLSRGRAPGFWAGHRENLLVAAVLASGVAASAAALHAGSGQSRAQTPLAALRADGAVPRVVTPVDAIALPVNRGFDYFDALQAVRSRTGAPPYAVPSRVDNFATYTGLLPRRYDDLLNALAVFGDEKGLAYGRFAVTHAVLTPPLSPRDEQVVRAVTGRGSLVLRDPEWGIDLWEVPHEPWARFAQRVLPVSGEAAAVAAVVKATAAGDPSVVLLGQAPPQLAPGKVLGIERAAEKIRIEAEAQGDGLLVVADAFWDGWQATLDGRPVPILLADGLVRAVPWPSGRHLLEMRYRPAELRVGAAVSAAAALLLAGCTLWSRRRSRRSL